jgi:23S rRNA (guanosine2251-2'-O)-methyltransferase
MGTEILFGVHPVAEALAAGRRKLMEVFVAKGRRAARIEALVAAAEARGIPVREETAERIASLCDSPGHQGVAARASAYPLAEPEDMLAGDAPFLLVLDGVVDPRNLGALVRSGVCVGVDGVLIPKDRAAPPTPAASKASAGALEHVRLARVTNLAATLRALKERGVWIAGLSRTEAVSLYDADLTGPLALVVGGEEKGIRPLVRSRCDFGLAIPQAGPVDSLNASVAGAVALYEAFRQRRAVVP